MADKIILDAKPRSLTGKKVRSLRREGRMPIIVYGAGTDPVPLDVEVKAFGSVAQQAGATQLIQLAVEGESKARAVLIRDVQQHVTRLTPIHADLIQVDLTQKIVATVPVIITKMPHMAETGAAIASQPTTGLSVEALPAEFPPAIEVDASGLQDFDEMIKVSDLDLGAEIEVLDDPDTVLISLSRPRAEEELEQLDEVLIDDEALEAEALEAPEEGEIPEEEGEAEPEED